MSRTNKWPAVVNIASISITDVNAGGFAESNNCRKEVDQQPGFPQSDVQAFGQGKRTADVTVKDDGGGKFQEVKLSGTGT
jgi:hypothetical protein